MKRVFIVALLFSLPACATFSFAPPVVDQHDQLENREYQRMFRGVCTPTPVSGSRIKHNVKGALALINNYELTYRCQRDRAANGRQGFEVPAFLGTAGAAAAGALGAPAAIAIVAGAGSAILDHTKQYYAPQQKAAVLSAGLGAILCIDNNAVGVDPYTLQTISEAQEQKESAPEVVAPAPPPVAPAAPPAVPLEPPVAPASPAIPFDNQSGAEAGVQIPYGRQYFEMIRSALFSVEQVVSQRLSAAGTPFDAKGVMAEIAALNQKQVSESSTPQAQNPTQTGQNTVDAITKTNTPVETVAGKTELKAVLVAKAPPAVLQLVATPAAKIGATMVKLSQLQTKLDQCIVEAKI